MEVRIAKTEKELEAVYSLRYAIYIEELGKAFLPHDKERKVLKDSLDDDAFQVCIYEEDDFDGSWESLLYGNASFVRKEEPSDLPTFLKESFHRLTKMTAKQFTYCCLLGTLNIIGVISLRQSISVGGVLEVPPTTPLGVFLHKGLVPVLLFYAVLFFVLPLARLAVILFLNSRIGQRNLLREYLAKSAQQ